jgi:hypothetical protein
MILLILQYQKRLDHRYAFFILLVMQMMTSIYEISDTCNGLKLKKRTFTLAWVYSSSNTSIFGLKYTHATTKLNCNSIIVLLLWQGLCLIFFNYLSNSFTSAIVPSSLILITVNDECFRASSLSS